MDYYVKHFKIENRPKTFFFSQVISTQVACMWEDTVTGFWNDNNVCTCHNNILFKIMLILPLLQWIGPPLSKTYLMFIDTYFTKSCHFYNTVKPVWSIFSSKERYISMLKLKHSLFHILSYLYMEALIRGGWSWEGTAFAWPLTRPFK